MYVSLHNDSTAIGLLRRLSLHCRFYCTWGSCKTFSMFPPCTNGGQDFGTPRVHVREEMVQMELRHAWELSSVLRKIPKFEAWPRYVPTISDQTLWDLQRHTEPLLLAGATNLPLGYSFGDFFCWNKVEHVTIKKTKLYSSPCEEQLFQLMAECTSILFSG